MSAPCDSISQMRRIIKALIVLLAVAALPMRGYAAVAATLCAEHHGGAPAAVHASAHAHADGGAGEMHDRNPAQLESGAQATVCSVCATCCGGASSAPHASHAPRLAPAGAEPIAFYSFAASGHVPDALDRPPLAL
jgi:hypothetical protein